MRSPLPAGRIRLALPVTLLAVACTDGSGPTTPDGTTGTSDTSPTVIVDYEAGQGVQFAFLEPLASGVPSGPLASGLTPKVHVCNAERPDTSTICILGLDADQRGDHYHANWKSRNTRPGETYTITVKESGLQLGQLSLVLDGRDGGRAGRTFPIKFWVGDGLADAIVQVGPCLADNRCDAAVVPDNQGLVVVTTIDESTNATMAQLTFPEGSVPDGGLIVVLDCRTVGFEPGDGPLPTALNQWPLFCNVTATSTDGTPFVSELPSPATIDICVVDEALDGDHHPWDVEERPDLVLGKSSGPDDFTFLDPATSILDCTGNSTIVAREERGGILGAIGSRLAMTFDLFRPEELRAAARRRDGGVGGQVGSFSDINPVEPAYIEGTVAFDHAGIEGVTVTLSGDASAVTTTDADGSYRFGPLQAAPSVEGGEVLGSFYTVSVSDLPEGEQVDEPSRDVHVTGSGVSTANFVAVLPEGVHYYAETNNYYQSFATIVDWNTARDTASSMSFRMCAGHLVTVLSQGENDFIATSMPEAVARNPSSPVAGGYWLGGFQNTASDDHAEPDGGWEWVTGEAIPPTNDGPGYANWASGEPNGANEDWLQFMGDWQPDNRSQWNNTLLDFSGGGGYVVEYECGS